MILWSIGFSLALLAQHTYTLEIIIAFIYKNFLISLAISCSFKVIAEMVIYFITVLCLKEKLTDIFGRYNLYYMLKYLARRQPMKTLIIIRFCPLPKWAKNYISPLLDYKVFDYFVSVTVSNLYFSIVAAILGL